MKLSHERGKKEPALYGVVFQADRRVTHGDRTYYNLFTGIPCAVQINRNEFGNVDF